MPLKHDDKHPALRTASGHVVALPQPFQVSEFSLAGNSREYHNLVGVYDPTTSTGASYEFGAASWTIFQPVSRGQFFLMLGALDAVAKQVQATQPEFGAPGADTGNGLQ